MACRPEASSFQFCEVAAVPSVVSEPSVFPILPLPGSRAPSPAADMFGAAPSGFAKLLDDSTATEAPVHAKRDRSDAVPAKDRSGVQVKDKDAAPETDEASTQDTSSQVTTSPAKADETAPNGNPQTPIETPKDVLVEAASSSGETPDPADTTAEAAILTIAVADLVLPTAAATAAVAATPAAPVVAPVLPDALPTAPAAPSKDTAVPAPGQTAADQASAVGAATPTQTPPVPAPAAPQAAQHAATPAIPAVPANGTGGPAVPATPAVPAQPAKAAPQSQAMGESTAGDEPVVAPSKPAAMPADATMLDEAEPRMDQAAPQPKAASERAGSAKPEVNAGRPATEAANAAATSDADPAQNSPAPSPSRHADPLQNLTVATALQHAAPAQSITAAHAAAAAAPTTPMPVHFVPVAGIAVEIAAQSLAGKNRFEIRLDPPELGRIDVRLEIDGDGHVKSRLIVERSETLDMLRRDAPQLERALQQAGLKTADNALEFSLRQHAPQRDNEPNQNTPRLIVPDENAGPLDAVQHNYGRRFGLGGGIDIRV